MGTREVNIDVSGILKRVRSRLRDKGIDLDIPDGFDVFGEGEGARVKVVCVAPDLKESVAEMGRRQRDQVVMVRVDAETLESLDAWVATGAVKSRSEAAALFIREGLKVRADELAQLRDALREVREAQERLRSRAREVFGREPDAAQEDAAREDAAREDDAAAPGASQ